MGKTTREYLSMSLGQMPKSVEWASFFVPEEEDKIGPEVGQGAEEVVVATFDEVEGSCGSGVLGVAVLVPPPPASLSGGAREIFFREKS